MTVLVTVETAVLAVLTVLVVGLLRGYAAVLDRLHQLDAARGAEPAEHADSAGSPPATAPATLAERTRHRIGARTEWGPAHDIEGVSVRGEIISARLVGVGHDTVLAFLSSGCDGCGGFWRELEQSQQGFGTMPHGYRTLVVTKGAEHESQAMLADLCPSGVDMVMSSQAWLDYNVPGSPYVIVVEGQTGRVKGEGSGSSFAQVGGLIARAVGDSRPKKGTVKPAPDRDRERDVDRALLAAGITPGDKSLYASPPEAAAGPLPRPDER